jgi:hypothetical protein
MLDDACDLVGDGKTSKPGEPKTAALDHWSKLISYWATFHH